MGTAAALQTSGRLVVTMYAWNVLHTQLDAASDNCLAVTTVVPRAVVVMVHCPDQPVSEIEGPSTTGPVALYTQQSNTVIFGWVC